MTHDLAETSSPLIRRGRWRRRTAARSECTRARQAQLIVGRLDTFLAATQLGITMDAWLEG